MEDTSVHQEVTDTQVAEAPVEVVQKCDSCGSVTELFDVAHHQVGNPKVWRYCQRCKLAHDVEVATNEKLREVMAVNPAATNDPAFVGQIRSQVTQELMQS